jgi:histidine triad (HIT) family protein
VKILRNPMTTPSNPDCIFCKIASGEIPATVVADDGELMAFPDIHPRAPVHLLIIPKAHVMRSVADMTPGQEALLGRMIALAKKLAEDQGIADDGYRLVFNVRHHGGQEVDHVHLHVLGGQPLGPLG